MVEGVITGFCGNDDGDGGACGGGGGVEMSGDVFDLVGGIGGRGCSSFFKVACLEIDDLVVLVLLGVAGI